MNTRYPNFSLFSPAPVDVFYFPNDRERPALAGPTSYYHAYRHLLDMHGVQIVPTYIENMMREIDRAEDGTETSNIIYHTITDNADDLLWMADEVDQLKQAEEMVFPQDNSAMQLCEETDSDEEYDWAQDFIDHHGIENSIARLLDLQLWRIDCKKITLEQLAFLLHRQGPIAIGMRSFTQLPIDAQPSEIVTMHTRHIQESREVYRADNNLSTGDGLYVLLIGIESSRRNVFFIDPNYPAILLSLSFESFKKHLSTGEYAHASENTLSPSPVKVFEIAEPQLIDRVNTKNSK